MRLFPILVLALAIGATSQARAEGLEIVGPKGDAEFLRLWIHNRSSTEAEIADVQLEDTSWPPIGLVVRLRDSSGEFVSINGANAEGWWTPRALRSQLSPRNQPAMTLLPNQVLSSVIPVEDMFAGMNILGQIQGDSCHYQAKFTLYSTDRSTVDTQVSDWVAISCRSVLPN